MTKAIRRLEESLGGRLFERSKTQVQLTSLGQTMLPNFRQIFDNAMQAREQARRFVSGNAEQVRVGVMCTIEFPQLLPGFNQSQSGRGEVSLSFHEGNLESLTESLDQGDVDLGVMCSPWDIPKRFAVTPLYREDYVVAFGDDHRFNGRQAVALAELNRERYCERIHCEFTVYIERLLTARGVNLEVVQQSAREDWIQAMVRANFGISFMPQSIAEAAGLAYVHAADVTIVREVKLLCQAERPITAAQQSVIDSLKGYRWSQGKLFGGAEVN